MSITSAPALHLVDHPRSLARLESTMRRVGATMNPEAFISIVSNAYHAAVARDYAENMHRMFRTSGSHEHFRRAMQRAKSLLGPQPLILNPGCGAGYDLEVIKEVFAADEIAEVVCLEPSLDMLELARSKVANYPCRLSTDNFAETVAPASVDLIVTHSLVHHIADLDRFFHDLNAVVKPGGCYVMGHEPNRAFWQNRECLALNEQYASERRYRHRLAKLVDPRRYVRRLLRGVGWQAPQGWEDKVNNALRREFGLVGNLTCQEIWRLVDIHVPDPFAGDFKIGYDGFSCQQMHETFLKDWRLEHFASWGYLGLQNPAEAPMHWRNIDQAMADRYPGDGSSFAAVWRKNPL